MQWRVLLSAVAECLMARPSGAKPGMLPIILAVRSTPYSGHVVVLRGMTRVPTPSVPMAVLHINGPLAHFARPVPLAQLRPQLAGGDRGGLIAPPCYTRSVYSKACFRAISCI